MNAVKTSKDIGERMRLLVSLSMVGQAGFGDIIEVSRTSMGNLARGQHEPSYTTLYNIATIFPFVNLRWLITGDGKPSIYEGEDAFDLIERFKEVFAKRK